MKKYQPFLISSCLLIIANYWFLFDSSPFWPIRFDYLAYAFFIFGIFKIYKEKKKNKK